MSQINYGIWSHSPDGAALLAVVCDFPCAILFARAWSNVIMTDGFRDEEWVNGKLKAGYAQYIDAGGFTCRVEEMRGHEDMFG